MLGGLTQQYVMFFPYMSYPETTTKQDYYYKIRRKEDSSRWSFGLLIGAIKWEAARFQRSAVWSLSSNRTNLDRATTTAQLSIANCLLLFMWFIVVVVLISGSGSSNLYITVWASSRSVTIMIPIAAAILTEAVVLQRSFGWLEAALVTIGSSISNCCSCGDVVYCR